MFTQIRSSLVPLLAAVALAGGSAMVFAQAPATAGATRADAAPTVLITGSNRGIGLALARGYAERGWQVIATARRPADAPELRALAARAANVEVVALDVTDHAMIDALAARLRGRPIDVLVHNAGISGGVPNQMLGRMNYTAFREVLEVNTIGPMKLSEALLENVRASQQKKIVLIGTSEASFAGINAGRLYWYRSSKAAAHMLMLNLAYEVRGRGIAVGIINPGPVDTDMMKGVRMPLQPPAEASAKVISVIDRLQLDNTARFWNYDGSELRW